MNLPVLFEEANCVEFPMNVWRAPALLQPGRLDPVQPDHSEHLQKHLGQLREAERRPERQGHVERKVKSELGKAGKLFNKFSEQSK